MTEVQYIQESSGTNGEGEEVVPQQVDLGKAKVPKILLRTPELLSWYCLCWQVGVKRGVNNPPVPFVRAVATVHHACVQLS